MAGIGAINVDVGSAISGLGTLAKDIREAITGKSILDPNKQAELLQKAADYEAQARQAQTNIALEEAKSASTFVAGARPYIMWICGSAMGWNFFAGPMFSWIASLCGKSVPVPTMDLSVMMPVLITMLGGFAYRTVEKIQGAEGNR
jgi:hypothetical protein